MKDLLKTTSEDAGISFLPHVMHMKGAEVGSLSEVPSSSCSVPENNSSVGFRMMLAKVIPKLQSAFNELGRDDHQSL